MEKKKRLPLRKRILILCIIFMYFAGLIISFKFLKPFFQVDMLTNIVRAKKQGEIQEYIDRFYYQTTDPSSISENIYKGYVDGLEDPYSEYYTKDEYAEFNVDLTGKYGGIGAVLTQDEDTKLISITKVYEDTPAWEAGLREGDVILTADGVECVDCDLHTFVTHIRGEEGTDVEIEYVRDGEKKTVSITRREVITPSVNSYMLDENTGYIQISEFKENTAVEFKEAIKSLESQGMENVVYDLRSNPGGLVSSVTEILDYMLPEGITVYMEDKYKRRTDYTSDEENQLKYPCVVLVNENSASASEIFSGAIRDFEYGTLLGTTTLGKGVVQNIFPLSDGSAVKLTIAEYFTPSGENIHKKGIDPDIELEYEYLGTDDEKYTWEHDNQVLKALELLD